MRFPDWLIYAGLVAGIMLIAGRWHDRSMAPPPPPPLSSGEMAIFAAFTPFTPGSLISVPSVDKPVMKGTAFSVSQSGAWVVSRQSLEGCAKPYLAIGGNLGVPFKVRLSADLDKYQLAITPGGVRPLPLAAASEVKIGQRGFMPGYPAGSVGEATGRLIGQTVLRKSKRFQNNETVLAWAEAGHTLGLRGSLDKLSGGPVLNAASQVVGITLAHKPRRGRIYSSTPQTLSRIARPHDRQPDFEREDILTRKNYGIVSDTLRRQYRVVQVACLDA
jgi:serine protease Do